MKKFDYGQLLKDPRWQKKRLEIMQRDNFSCVLCGDKESTLHVHHNYYRPRRKPWEYPNESLMTLCEECHSEVSSENELVDDLFKDLKSGLLEHGMTVNVLFNLFWEIVDFLYNGKWNHTHKDTFNLFRDCFNVKHDLELFDYYMENGGFNGKKRTETDKSDNI